MSAKQAGTVWAATWVPSPSPIPGYGGQGYAVAWVDTAEERVQVLVDGHAPPPGTEGRIVEHVFGDTAVLLFEANER